MVIKIIGTETSCNSTASNFNNSKLLRILNKNTSVFALLTYAYANASTIGTMTIRPNSDILLEKNMTDIVSSNNNADVLAVSVAFKN